MDNIYNLSNYIINLQIKYSLDFYYLDVEIKNMSDCLFKQQVLTLSTPKHEKFIYSLKN